MDNRTWRFGTLGAYEDFLERKSKPGGKPRTPQEIHFYNELRKAQSDEGPDLPFDSWFDGPTTRKESAREVIVRLALEHGYSEKQLWYYLEKWSGKGWWDYGVNLGVGWFEPEAPDRLE